MSQRFRLFGGKEPTIKEVIKDCRELEAELATLRTQNEGLLKRIEALEKT